MLNETTERPWTLGFDPGTQGAATLLGFAGVHAVWAWRDRQRGGERCFQVAMAWLDHEKGWQCQITMKARMHDVGVLIARQAQKFIGRLRFRVWSEAAHVSSHIRNPKTTIRIGWITGAITGPSEKFAPGRRIPEVQAAEWRHKLLGLPIRTKRDPAKAASLKHMPKRLPGLAQALALIAAGYNVPTAKLDHVTDSGGVAEYGQRFGGAK